MSLLIHSENSKHRNRYKKNNTMRKRKRKKERVRENKAASDRSSEQHERCKLVTRFRRQGLLSTVVSLSSATGGEGQEVRRAQHRSPAQGAPVSPRDKPLCLKDGMRVTTDLRPVYPNNQRHSLPLIRSCAM